MNLYDMFCPFSATLTMLVMFQQAPRGTVVQAHQNADFNFSPEQSECIHSLLLDPHRIPSSAFTASSEQSDATGTRRYSAEFVRVENADFAWCPSKRVGTELEEFVQIDLGELYAITKVVISGLLAEGGGSRFAPYFYIRYKREVGEREWRTYRQLYPTQTTRLVGSTTALVPKFVVLNPPVIARWIRVYPYRDSPGFVCVRLEAYGCRYTDDLVEYQIPEGSIAVPTHRSSALSDVLVKPSALLSRDNQTRYYMAGGGPAFSDACYDGYRAEPGSLLDGGLGCLADLGIAPENSTPNPWIDPVPALDPATFRSAHWFVGWHRSRWTGSQTEHGQDVVDMRLRFSTIRSFIRMKLYASNNFPNKIRLPRRIEVRFSVHGLLFSDQPKISQDLVSDNRTRGVMNIELDLENRIGKFVQLKLFFADDWLLLSEIKFYSHLSTGPVASEELTNSRRSKKDPRTPIISSPTATVAPVEFADFSSRHLPTVIILALLIVTFLLVIGFTCSRLLWRSKHWHARKRKRYPHTITTESDDCSRVLAGSQIPQFLNQNGTLPRKAKSNDKAHHSENVNCSKSRPTNRPSGSAHPGDGFSHSAYAQHIPFATDGLAEPRASLLQILRSAFCPRGMSKYRRSTSHVDAGVFQQTKYSSGLSTGNFQNSVQVYPTTTHLIHDNQCGEFENGQTGMYFGPTGPFNQTTPQTMLNEMNQHVEALRSPYSMAHEGHGRLPHIPNQIGSEWFMHSGYSNTATNSTGASGGIGAINPDPNLYTTVGGESDCDSNCASTLSPEYASTNPVWNGQTLQPPHQRAAQMPIMSTAKVSRSILPTSLTFSTLPTVVSSSDHVPNNTTTSRPLIYFNHALSALTSPGHAGLPDAMPVQFYNPYPQSTNSTMYFSQPYSPFVESVNGFCGVPVSLNRKHPDSRTVMPFGSPTFISHLCRDVSVPHARPIAMLNSDKTVGKPSSLDTYCTPEETSSRSLLDSGGIDSGPWIKSNRFDPCRVPSDRRCPPVPSTPPPPPPPPSLRL